MITEESIISTFVMWHHMEVIEIADEKKWEINQSEEFISWFREWISDRWASYVTQTVQHMTRTQKTELLVEYGLDEAIELYKMNSESMQDLSVDKIVWNVIHHWYDEEYIITKIITRTDTRYPS